VANRLGESSELAWPSSVSVLPSPFSLDTFRRPDHWKKSPPYGSKDIRVGMNMQITEVKIYSTDHDLVRAYVTITFDNCIEIREIKVIKSSTGLFVSMPTSKRKDGSHRYIAYPANTETRNMIQQVILAEYEKVVGARDHPVPSENLKANSGDRQ
jgi:stage V sporulation protein G